MGKLSGLNWGKKEGFGADYKWGAICLTRSRTTIENKQTTGKKRGEGVLGDYKCISCSN